MILVSGINSADFFARMRIRMFNADLAGRYSSCSVIVYLLVNAANKSFRLPSARERSPFVASFFVASMDQYLEYL